MVDEEKYKKINEKINEIQEEIFNLAWVGILDKYHPDMNCDDPDADKVFRVYREIFGNMKKRVLDDKVSWG